MNRFEFISEQEYEKAVAEECNVKNGVLSVSKYHELKKPRRATSGSAGYDFFSPVSFKLQPGQTIKIPTFIKCYLNPGTVLMMFPRSSYGFKYRMQLDNTVGIIDQDYYNNESNEGHIFIKITNDSKTNKTLVVNRGDAVAQGIILFYSIAADDDTRTQRTGGIGSTSNN